ncbi:predicted protein [Sclerotinia sclerotiorum 1980 UF-70]|uniref:Uncharacterized protein n=1 Tax=Sclerotinia sclerotiorum (strain ATCC 18683 / 1980 / Ss-1) TaxID=665079 RepID=A7EJ97_SCLS1|nr:predicted protein [Sclerotinia sclerotiorum 1980 UF-70]EDO02913.1 predicted protein [Sclerotinia sclerotiorum 1980 UF-70]
MEEEFWIFRLSELNESTKTIFDMSRAVSTDPDEEATIKCLQGGARTIFFSDDHEGMISVRESGIETDTGRATMEERYDNQLIKPLLLGKANK